MHEVVAAVQGADLHEGRTGFEHTVRGDRVLRHVRQRNGDAVARPDA